MQTAALIVAAGMSSRMGDFKPMLNIGSISISRRVIASLQQAGGDKIVMVTGYNAVQLERHLSGLGIVFLRNEQYASTQMFTSAGIGLSYLKDKCDRLLLPLWIFRSLPPQRFRRFWRAALPSRVLSVTGSAVIRS